MVPAADQEIVLPWASAMVIIVLLNDAYVRDARRDVLALAAFNARGFLFSHFLPSVLYRRCRSSSSYTYIELRGE